MSRLIVSNIETQNIKFDSDTTAFTIGSDGVMSDIKTTNYKFSTLAVSTISSQVGQVDFTVPSGTKLVTVTYRNVSGTATAELYWRVGNSSGVLTSGYLGGSAYIHASAAAGSNATSAFQMASGYNSAANIFNGIARFLTIDGRYWIFNNHVNSSAYPDGCIVGAGVVDLGSVTDLTTVRCYPGSGNLDSGAFKCYFQ